jgi:uncharacterized damage-inducible protein DinB
VSKKKVAEDELKGA